MMFGQVVANGLYPAVGTQPSVSPPTHQPVQQAYQVIS